MSRGGLPTGTCTKQLVRDKPFCVLRVYFRRCSVRSSLCSAPGAKGRRKVAPAQLQLGKQKSPASSRSVHTEMPICFQNQILHGYTEQRQLFAIQAIFLVSALERQQLEQAKEIERHRVSTLPVKFQSSGVAPGWDKPSGGAGEGALLPPVPVQAPHKLDSPVLPTRQSHLKYRLGILCQDPTTDQFPTKLHSH